MKLFIGTDHRGFALKEQLVTWLQEEGHDVVDCGNTKHDTEDDYPDYALPVGEQVILTKDAKGIVLCGSGVGVSIAVNKVVGVRSGVAHSESQVQSMRNDDDINILALGADGLELDDAKKYIRVFLETPASAEPRHKRRLDKIFSYEYGSGCCGGNGSDCGGGGCSC